MSSIVKCNNCNIVINEVLAFVSNKMEVMDEDSISRICTSAFSKDEILNAKKLLLDSIPTSRHKKNRKGEGKATRDIDDILSSLKEAHPEEIPTFVARDLHKLPPVLFDHVDVTRLLKDIVRLQADIKELREQSVSSDQFEHLKNEVQNMKQRPYTSESYRGVNLRRGAYMLNDSSLQCNSGPMGLIQDIITESHSGESPNATTNGILIEQNQNNTFVEVEGKNVSLSTPTVDIAIARPNGECAYGHECQINECVTVSNTDHRQNSSLAVKMTLPPKQSQQSTSTSAEIVSAGVWKPENKTEEWKTVQRKRYRNKFVGKMGTGESSVLQAGFKAADVKIPIYVYNVNKGTASQDIISYIENKTKMKVTVQQMNLKQTKEYDAYKIYVPRSNIEMFMETNFWPQGVRFRRFIEFRHRNPDGGTRFRVQQDNNSVING